MRHLLKKVKFAWAKRRGARAGGACLHACKLITKKSHLNSLKRKGTYAMLDTT